MKKFAVALLALVLLCTLVAPTFAANKNAFENVVMNDNADEFAYITNDSGRTRSGKNIQYMEAYGCGYGAEGDMVQFKNIDFGKTGAKEMTLSVSYGGEGTTTLSAYLDDPKSTPIANFSVTNTGGWDKKAAKEFTSAVSVAGGVHDVYVKFTNDQSGSFSYLRFAEADAPVATTGTTGTTAPATADMGVIASIAAIMTSAAGFVALKRKH